MLSVAKFAAVLSAIYGLIIAFVGLLGAGVGLAVIFVAAMAIVGFVTGAILAFTYNIVFSMTGGIAMELEFADD